MAKLNVYNLIVIIVFSAVCAASLYLKLVPVLNYNFPFTMDQARDTLDIRHIVELKNPTLIGPTTSINGVFLGPFYYYFNLLPFMVSGGDPAALTYWNIAWYIIAGIVLFAFFFKKDAYLGFFSSAIFLMAPALFYSSRYFWSANPMPYMTIFYFLSILLFFDQGDKKRSFISILNFLGKPGILNSALIGLISGLSMQIEAAFAVMFLPFFLLFGVFKRVKINHLAASIAAFSITLIPQILFELRNNFLMTRTFYKEVSGSSEILGDKLTLAETFASHIRTYFEFTSGQLQISESFSILILIAAVIYLGIRFFQKKMDSNSKNLFLISITFILFSFVFYMLYAHPLKGWYLLGLRIPYIFLLALFFTEVFRQKSPVLKSLTIVLICLSFLNTFSDQSKFILKNISDRSLDKSTLRNEIEAIDWVYEKAQGRGFKAYNYIPSVYDFPYQYLYWWHGTKKYGYQPEVLTYLDNVPEYIKDNDKFFLFKKPAGDNIFLIYEPDENQERLDAWLGNFTKLCTIEKETFSWGTTVEFKKECN